MISSHFSASNILMIIFVLQSLTSSLSLDPNNLLSSFFDVSLAEIIIYLKMLRRRWLFVTYVLGFVLPFLYLSYGILDEVTSFPYQAY